MSLVSSRLALRHRCIIERDASDGGADDGWENPPDWQTHLADLPCRSWTRTGREQVADKETIVVVEEMRLLVSLGTDVTAQDRVANVTERGDTIIAGPVGIRAVIHRKDHLELVLVRAT